MIVMGFTGGSVVKNLPAMRKTQVQCLGQEYSLEKETATHSSIVAVKLYGQRNLAGYWNQPGSIESDMT